MSTSTGSTYTGPTCGAFQAVPDPMSGLFTPQPFRPTPAAAETTTPTPAPVVIPGRHRVTVLAEPWDPAQLVQPVAFTPVTWAPMEGEGLIHLAQDPGAIVLATI